MPTFELKITYANDAMVDTLDVAQSIEDVADTLRDNYARLTAETTAHLNQQITDENSEVVGSWRVIN